MIGSLEPSREFTPISHRLTFSFSQEFSTVAEARAFDEECRRALGRRVKDRKPTLLDEPSATAEPEINEPEPLEAADRDVEQPTTPTPPARRSVRLMMKKAKATATEATTSKIIGQPRRKKASPARLARPPAAPRRSPRLRSKSAVVGLQSEKATPSVSSTRRSTRARRKPIRFTP